MRTSTLRHWLLALLAAVAVMASSATMANPALATGSGVSNLASSISASAAPVEAEVDPWARRGIHNYRLFALGVLALALILVWNWRLRREVRKRQAVERALSDQLAFQQALFDGIPQPVYVRDREGRLVSANRSLCEALQTTREQLLGKRIVDANWFSPADAQRYQQRYLDALASEQPQFADLQLQIGGRSIEVYAWLVPNRDSSGAVTGMVGGWVDVTERHRLLEALRIAKEQADQASQAKSTFLATMSHEIRTPISAVIGMLELTLRRAEEGVWEREPIEVAYESANSLLALLGDILDIAKIEAGRFSLAPERGNPGKLASSVVKVFAGLARDKQLGLELDVQAEAATDVLIDPLRFKQILGNLISNAIKFTETGGVRVALRVDADDAENLHLQVQVRDSGIGISAAAQRLLFESFMQVREPGQASRGGTGLGLAICRALAEMMGGRIELSSQPGQGTEVTVHLTFPRLPALPAATADTTPADVPSLAPRRLSVLIADDHAPNRLLLAQQLGYLGHRTQTATDGAQALELWRQEHFDLLITDCNMPRLSGYALAQEVRRLEQGCGQPACTIFGCTANAQAEELLRCQQAGMDDCLFKPVSLDRLRKRLEALALPVVPPAVCRLGALDALTGGDRTITRELLQGSLRANRADLATALELVDDGDWPALAAQAHKIKGGARLLNADELVALCEALEAACRSGAARNSVLAPVNALAAGIERLEAALIRYLDDAAEAAPPG
ncbi:response regulator [Pseudomonas sp. UL073]|uniref:histidine kinase n=1 Tax=Zestomonas insulae TaxID=2809017 RepID=A0ABS2IAX7_9GAMM|nr:ATP-binding protein [Pseudomonas insulae]MBM7060274.1 response regulator [Pseudomonas insulae]